MSSPPASPHEFDTSQVRRYYDLQTGAFLAFGDGGGSIHRAVWGPGVSSRREAFHYVEDQLVAIITGLEHTTLTPHVVDFGCGVGASLVYLVSQVPIRATGITISPVQARLAAERFEASGRSQQLTCLEGDYSMLPADLAPVDLGYAIESFVHAQNPALFFAECRRVIRPGGVLAICDDMRRPTGDPEAARAIEQFCRGWHVNTLMTSDDLGALAAAHGFDHESTLDLSPWLELDRFRDRAVRLLLSLFGGLPWNHTRFRHLLGGNALQTCLANGWIGYELTLFRRQGTLHATPVDDDRPS